MASYRPPPQSADNKLTLQTLVDAVYDLWFGTDKWTVHQVSEQEETTAAIATIDRVTLEQSTTAHIHSVIVGVEAGSGNRASYEIAGTFYRDGGGVIQQGTTTVLYSEESDGSWNAFFSPEGNDVRIRVQGAALWRSSTSINFLSN